MTSINENVFVCDISALFRICRPIHARDGGIPRAFRETGVGGRTRGPLRAALWCSRCRAQKDPHMPLSPIERQERQMQLDMAEKALGSALYSKKWDEGYRMASKQAMDLATATLV
jgi:hypothetical protein